MGQAGDERLANRFGNSVVGGRPRAVRCLSFPGYQRQVVLISGPVRPKMEGTMRC